MSNTHFVDLKTNGFENNVRSVCRLCTIDKSQEIDNLLILPTRLEHTHNNVLNNTIKERAISNALNKAVKCKEGSVELKVSLVVT